MSSTARRAPQCSRTGLAACLVVAAVVEGCGRTQTAEQALARQFEQHPEFKKATLAKFSGHVTVDGMPPANDAQLFVILNDPKNPEEAAHSKLPTLFSICDLEGKFSFRTYLAGDGVTAGKYVLTFVALHSSAKSGHRVMGGALFSPPDELKNLYNDPDQNAKQEKFNLDLQPPGKGDYEFDLAVAGEQPVETPGPNAWTRIAFH
jgi:hypothetical protein